MSDYYDSVMRFAKYVFLLAGIYGLLVMLPQYFLERRIGVDNPPAITHPEYFYGFVGIVVAFQLVFIVISRDPARYRPLMLVAVVEKLAFAVPVPILFVLDRVRANVLGFSMIDAVLAVLFAIAYFKTGSPGDVISTSNKAPR